MTKKNKKISETKNIDEISDRELEKKLLEEFKEDVIYNRSNLENESIKLELNLNLYNTRMLSKYLEDELVIGLSNMLTSLHTRAANDENSEHDNFSSTIDFYTNIYNIFNELAEITYRGMVEKEKDIIDTLKQEGVPEDGVLEILATEEKDYQRISNIFQAVDDLEIEEQEAEKLKKALPFLTKNILNKLEADITSLYMPLVIKFVSFLSQSTLNYSNHFNESIFSESALEELLDLDLDALDVFLTKLSKVKVKMGDVEGYLVDKFTIYNNTTVIVQYPIFITNPIKYQQFFHPLEVKKLLVTFET